MVSAGIGFSIQLSEQLSNLNLEHQKISIIIPVLNEAARIAAVINQIEKSAEIEIIVVDGGSIDNTVEVASSLGVRVISTQKGRSLQMNTGAQIASGEILLFLHADTELPQGFAALVHAALNQLQVIAGAFELKIDGGHRGLRLIEKMVSLRSHFFQLPYGDQAIFIKAKTFWQFGGFPELPIMEDFEFIHRLKRYGKIKILPAAVITSGRRWQQLGILKTTLINQFMILGYYLGIPPEKLAYFYRKKRNERKKS